MPLRIASLSNETLERMSGKDKSSVRSRTLQTSFSAGRFAVTEAIALVDAFCASNRIGHGDGIALRLIVEELVVNTLKHGRAPAISPITLAMARANQKVELHYSDCGLPFNPLQDLPSPDREEHARNHAVGGLGWHLIRHYCASIDYQRVNGQNRLVLVRLLQDDINPFLEDR